MMRNVHHAMVFCGLGLGIGLGLASCATAQPVPTEKLASSQAAIRAAAEVGAQKVPEASLYLRFAEEEQAAGNVQVAAGKTAEAAVSFKRASADAELALGLAREATAKNEAKVAATALQTGQTGAK
jgi:hypothetical protein